MSPALIDTGSQVTTIAESFRKDLKEVEVRPLDHLLTLKGAGNNILPYLGYVEITLNLKPKEQHGHDVLALVVPGEAYRADVPVVVGTNALQAAYDNLRACAQTLEVPLQQAVEFLQRVDTADGVVGSVKTTKKEVIRPGERVILRGITRAGASGPRMDVITEASWEHALPGGILVTPAIHKIGGKQVTCDRIYGSRGV